jgi:hypothetical protein
VNKSEYIEAIQELDAEYKLSGEERVHELAVIHRGLTAPAEIAELEGTVEELNTALAESENKVAAAKDGLVKVGEVEDEAIFMTIPRAKYTDKNGEKHLVTPEVLQNNHELLVEMVSNEANFLLTK